MESNLPFVTAALVCERVLEEKNGTLSAIRIIDRAEVDFGTNDPETQKVLEKVAPGMQITLLLSLKSGPLSGNYTTYVDVVKPSGKRNRMFTIPTPFHGGDSGVNFVLNITVLVEEEGTFWFETFFEEKLLTKVPLTLARSQQRAQEAAGGEPKK